MDDITLEGAPVSSLFITTGVRDAGSVSTLMRLQRQFDLTEASGARLAGTLALIQNSLIGIGRRTGALATLSNKLNTLNPTRVNATAVALERLAIANAAAVGSGRVLIGGAAGGGAGAPAAFIGAGGRGQTGGRLPLGAGAFGAFAGFAALGLGVSAVSQRAQVEQAAIRAAFAAAPTGTNPRIAALAAPGLRREGVSLAREFRLGGILPGVTLTRELAQIGPATRDPAARRALSQAALAFSILEPDVPPEEAAAAFFRLIQSTGGQRAQTAGGLAGLLSTQAVGVGGLIARGGEVSAAGPGTVLEFVRSLQSTGVTAGATIPEVVALASALSTIDPTRPTTFATAIQRISSKEFLDTAQAGRIAQFLGMDPNTFNQRARTAPIPLFVELTRALTQRPGDELAGPIATELGFGNVRDVRTIATLGAGLQVFEELAGQTRFEEDQSLLARTSVLLNTLQGDLDNLKTSASAFADTTLRFLNPALRGLLITGAGVFGTLADSPLLTAAAALTGVGLAGRGLSRFARPGGPGTARRAGFLGTTADIASIALLAPFRGARRLPGAGRLGGFLAARSVLGRQAALGALTQGAGRFGILSAFGGGALGIGARAAGGGLIGLGLGALSLAAPVFRNMEDMFQSLSTRGGTIGLVFELMRRLFQFLAFSGEKINQGLDAFGGFFKDVFGPVGGAINQGAEFIRTEVLGGDPRQARGGGDQTPEVRPAAIDARGSTFNIGGGEPAVSQFFDTALAGSVGRA